MRFEYLADSTELGIEEKLCACGGLADRVVSSPSLRTIVRGNHDFAVREKARLDKRSDDHWKKQGQDEGIDRARLQLKKHAARV